MTANIRRLLLLVGLVMVVPLMAISQVAIKRLVLAGYKGNVPVRQIEGKDYIEIEALARLANGTVSFNGEQATLTLPAPKAEAPASEEASSEKFSIGFLRAWIEEMATIREWHSALATAIRSQTPIWQSWLESYQLRASTDLQLVQASAATEADHKAAPLVSNEYEAMKRLNDEYVARRASVSYISPDSLTDDPLNQSVTQCGQALESMAASGQFSDSGSCR